MLDYHNEYRELKNWIVNLLNQIIQIKTILLLNANNSMIIIHVNII